MSTSQNPRPEQSEQTEDLFEEPDYEKFTDAELDALYQGEPLENVKANQGTAKSPKSAKPSAALPIDDDVEPDEIDPAMELELRAEFDNENFIEDDWDEAANDDEFGDL